MNAWRRILHRCLAPDDLLRDIVFRRLWCSVLISSLGAQVTLLALPLTAAVLMQATPTQMGWLTAMEIAPFVLFSLPGGVWLDRVRKLPVYLAGEALLACAVGSVPVAWWLDGLAMSWLYAVAFCIGTVSTVAGSAAQVVLTHVVSRERLVEAHAKSSLATSGAEVVGPGVGGVLIRLLGAPVALLVDAMALLSSALILRSLHIHEEKPRPGPSSSFLADLAEGLRFVAGQRLLVALATCVGVLQMCHHAALVTQILFATRVLGMSEQAVGACYVALGVGTVSTSLLGGRISRRIGAGPSLVLGLVVTGTGWSLLSLAPEGPWGVAAFVAMLFLFGLGMVLVFVNFLALRQAATPQPMLGRMTATMRWLTLLPAGPGALFGGWLGEHLGLRAALAFAGVTVLLLAAAAWHWPAIRRTLELPAPQAHGALALDDEAT